MKNHTKLSYLLLCSILVSGNLSIAEFPVSKGAGIGGLALTLVFGLGARAKHLNDKYYHENKDPDFEYIATKLGSLTVAALALEYSCGSKELTFPRCADLVAKSCLILGSCCLGTDTVANALRPIPVIGGLFTDPPSRENKKKERKHIGAYVRIFLPYMTARMFGVQQGWLKP